MGLVLPEGRGTKSAFVVRSFRGGFLEERAIDGLGSSVRERAKLAGSGQAAYGSSIAKGAAVECMFGNEEASSGEHDRLNAHARTRCQHRLRPPSLKPSLL